METVEITKVHISFSTLHCMISYSFPPLITNMFLWGLQNAHPLYFLLQCLHLILQLHASYQHCTTLPRVFMVKFLLFSFTPKAVHNWPTTSFLLAQESPNFFWKGTEGNVLGFVGHMVSVMTHLCLCSEKLANNDM